MENKKLTMIFIAVIIMLSVAGCTAGYNSMVNVPAPNGDLAGFWMGWWHGIISPLTFIVSLFTESVSIYEIHNTGGWYDFGFALGAGLILKGGSKATKKVYYKKTSLDLLAW